MVFCCLRMFMCSDLLSVLQVQHPGVQDLMMTDIRNLQAFALYMQKTDIKFDLYSVTKEMEKQVYIIFVQAVVVD